MPPNKKGAARVKFLAMKETIENELKQGFCRSDVYRNHQGSLGMSYSQFARLVNSHILKPKIAEKPTVETSETTAERAKNDRENSQPDRNKRQGFKPRPVHFDPDPDPNKIRDWLSPARKSEEG